EAFSLPLVDEKSKLPAISSNVDRPDVMEQVTEPVTFFACILPDDPWSVRSPSILEALICPELTTRRVFSPLTLSTTIWPEEFLISSTTSSGPVIFKYLLGPL